MTKQDWFDIGQMVLNVIFAIWGVIIHRKTNGGPT